jgi:diguanylate cyclase (GGDEF)-like protein/PAS domain S-box-containing protein
VQSARRQAFSNAAVCAAALAMVFLVFVIWQLRPLRQLERRAAHLMAGDDHDAEDWPDDGGEIGQLARTLRHVWAERAQIERFNAQVLQKLGSVMAAAPVGLAFTRGQRFELVSAECCRMLGRSEDMLLGQSTQSILASNEDYLSVGPQVVAAFASGDTYVGDWQLLRGDGSVFWARLHARPVAADDASQGTIWSMYDVSEQIDDRRRLEHAAMHDALTGVTNRKGFDLAIATTFANRSAAHSAVLVMIDLDHFKPINDTAGHAAGDAVLKAVALALASQIRSSDVVARIGGDEFAVLLPGCDMAHALAIAGKLRAAVAGVSLTWSDHVLQVGASMGLAALSTRHRDCADWVAEADAACYAVKRQGRATAGTTAPRLKLVDAG